MHRGNGNPSRQLFNASFQDDGVPYRTTVRLVSGLFHSVNWGLFGVFSVGFGEIR